jgi:hypothetical protein
MRKKVDDRAAFRSQHGCSKWHDGSGGSGLASNEIASVFLDVLLQDGLGLARNGIARHVNSIPLRLALNRLRGRSELILCKPEIFDAYAGLFTALESSGIALLLQLDLFIHGAL